MTRSRRPRAAVAVLTAVLLALGLATSAAGATGQVAAGNRSVVAPAAPAPTGPALAAMIAERKRFFGAENVDPKTGALPRDEVHLVWVSVATFAAALDGHVVLFDAYLHKAEEGKRNYVPATTEDLIALRPKAIFLGHAHYDHGQLAGTIAAATGATIVGTQGHCDQSSADAKRKLACVVAFGPKATFGAVKEVAVLPGVCSTAVLHVHSAAEPPDPTRDPTNTAVGLPDPGTILQHPPGPSTTLIAPGDEGGTVLYQIRIGHFTLTMHDSSGPLKEVAPKVFDVFRRLPKTDVQVGALVSFNNVTNGLRDPAMYIDAFNPKVFVPNHHDFVGGEYGGADDFEPKLERELKAYKARPEIRFLYDPFDYVRPGILRFDVEAPRWVDAGATPCARLARSANAADGSGRTAGTAKGALPTTGFGLGSGALAVLLVVTGLIGVRLARRRARI